MMPLPPQCESLERPALERVQSEQLRALLPPIVPRNCFYRRKFAEAGLDPAGIQGTADLSRLPYTTKTELLADQQANPPYGTNLTYPVERYCRLHQTSGTAGKPLRWLDTAESW